MILEKQAEAFAPACALTMDEVFHGCVHALQLAKPLHSQHRKSYQADQKRQHKEDDAVLYGVGNQHSDGQQGEQSACQLKHEAGTGQQPRAQSDEQGQDKRQRRNENFQDEHFAASFSQSAVSASRSLTSFAFFFSVKLRSLPVISGSWKLS